jgi:hypothetical protein
VRSRACQNRQLDEHNAIDCELVKGRSKIADSILVRARVDENLSSALLLAVQSLSGAPVPSPQSHLTGGGPGSKPRVPTTSTTSKVVKEVDGSIVTLTQTVTTGGDGHPVSKRSRLSRSSRPPDTSAAASAGGLSSGGGRSFHTPAPSATSAPASSSGLFGAGGGYGASSFPSSIPPGMKPGPRVAGAILGQGRTPLFLEVFWHMMKHNPELLVQFENLGDRWLSLQRGAHCKALPRSELSLVPALGPYSCFGFDGQRVGCIVCTTREQRVKVSALAPIVPVLRVNRVTQQLSLQHPRTAGVAFGFVGVDFSSAKKDWVHRAYTDTCRREHNRNFLAGGGEVEGLCMTEWAHRMSPFAYLEVFRHCLMALHDFSSGVSSALGGSPHVSASCSGSMGVSAAASGRVVGPPKSQSVVTGSSTGAGSGPGRGGSVDRPLRDGGDELFSGRAAVLQTLNLWDLFVGGGVLSACWTHYFEWIDRSRNDLQRRHFLRDYEHNALYLGCLEKYGEGVNSELSSEVVAVLQWIVQLYCSQRFADIGYRRFTAELATYLLQGFERGLGIPTTRVVDVYTSLRCPDDAPAFRAKMVDAEQPMAVFEYPRTDLVQFGHVLRDNPNTRVKHADLSGAVSSRRVISCACHLLYLCSGVHASETHLFLLCFMAGMLPPPPRARPMSVAATGVDLPVP